MPAIFLDEFFEFSAKVAWGQDTRFFTGDVAAGLRSVSPNGKLLLRDQSRLESWNLHESAIVLAGELATVDEDGLAADVGGVVAGQKRDYAGDLFRLAVSIHGDLLRIGGFEQRVFDALVTGR